MLIKEISSKECFDTLSCATVGRLGCSFNDQPYVVPIYFAYEADWIYVFSTFGKKIEWMRANPKVCVEIEEKVSESVARLVARRADAIVAASEAIAEEARGLDPGGEVTTILNGADFDDFAGLAYRRGDRFRITHTGSFFGKRDPRPFLTALAESGLDDVVARFVGDFRAADREWVPELGLGDRLRAAGLAEGELWQRLDGGTVSPQVSPDGSQVAYVFGGDLYVVPVGGGRVHGLPVQLPVRLRHLVQRARLLRHAARQLPPGERLDEQVGRGRAQA